MSQYIRDELSLLIFALCIGFILKFLYDILIIFRNTIGYSKRRIAIQDFLYWIFAGYLIFTGLYIENHGALRLFFILGVFFGAVIWYWAVSRWFVHYFTCFFRKILLVFGKIIKWLLFYGRRCKISLLKIMRKK